LESQAVQLRGEENQTGLPDNLKAGVENLSGYSLDEVKVHYNSPKPAELQALAYTQGTEIHVGPGQEEHLPHEAWHVVQQMQERVKPTMQMKGVQINDDVGLEREADQMGPIVMTRSKSKEITQKRSIQNNKITQCELEDWVKELLSVSEEKERLLTQMREAAKRNENPFVIMRDWLISYTGNENPPADDTKEAMVLVGFTRKQDENEGEDEEELPKSKPDFLYRWVSTKDAQSAKKEGIIYEENGGGIPTSTQGGENIAINSGAISIDKCLRITTSKISSFKWEFVSTRTKLKEVKIKCDVPPEAIEILDKKIAKDKHKIKKDEKKIKKG
jgi:hypothetical protein